MNIREIEHDRLLENLKTALKEYVDYVEYIKRANAAPKKRKHSKGQRTTFLTVTRAVTRGANRRRQHEEVQTVDCNSGTPLRPWLGSHGCSGERVETVQTRVLPRV